MFPLKQSLAEYGFESRDNYDFAIQCFLENPTENIRCLYVDGDPGRRKTAFAHALGQALNFDHLLYFECGTEKPAPQIVRMHEGEEVAEEPPTHPFDRIMTEACALSEADNTVLILDCLHKAEFHQHLRLYEFIKTRTWSYSDVTFFANQQNLLIFLIADESLYHSLQQNSYRIWIKALAGQTGSVQADELGLDEGSGEWLKPLNALIDQLGLSPTLSEYRKLAYDIETFVRTEDQLRTSVFGWIENVDRDRLYSKALQSTVNEVMVAIESNLSIHEEIELSSVGSD